jgi:hypothetical protein
MRTSPTSFEGCRIKKMNFLEGRKMNGESSSLVQDRSENLKTDFLEIGMKGKVGIESCKTTSTFFRWTMIG